MNTRVSSTPRLRRDKSGRVSRDQYGRFVRDSRPSVAEAPKLPRHLGDLPVALDQRVRIADVDRAIAAEVHDGYLWVTLADQRRLGAPLERFSTSSDLEPDATTLAQVSPSRLARLIIEDDGATVYLPEVPEWVYVPALLGYPLD